MQSIPVRAWCLSIFSAILQVLCFPVAGPVPAWRSWLCWFALTPLLLALLSPQAKKPLTIGAAAVLGYVCGVCWYLGNCAWIYQTMSLYGGLSEPVSFAVLILFALYLGLYHALFAILLTKVRRSPFGIYGSLLVAPFLWVAVEFGRTRITGFPWDLLGNAQIDNLLLTRLAPWAGVMSISFMVLVVNAAMTWVCLHPGGRRTILGTVSIIIAVFFLQTAGSSPILKRSMVKSDAAKASVTAVLLQENLEVGTVGRSAEPVSAIEEVQLFSAESLRATQVGSSTLLQSQMLSKGNRPSLIVWPEAPAHLQSNDPTFRSAMSALALRADSPLVIGSLGVDFSTVPSRGYYLYDSASLFQADGTYQGRYDKIHLVPWGEYIPFKAFFAFARKLTEGAGDMDRGTRRTVFTSQGHHYGVFVCYESIFGNEVRQFVQNGAEVLVNISDDGWYGDSGAPWQHLNMARMRAIENHRWLLRSTNTGVTTAIDPYGRMDGQAPRHVRGAFSFPFAFEQGTTFYTRHGDWFAYLCTLVTLLCLGFSFQSRMN